MQSWRRTLPNFGEASTSRLGARELHLSHWTGTTALLEAWTDWVYGGRYHHLFGRLTYAGQPVYGFSASRVGSPNDDYGRKGNGARYRLNVVGPGVTPDVSIVVPGLHDYDRNNAADVAYERRQNAVLDSILGVDKKCRVH